MNDQPLRTAAPRARRAHATTLATTLATLLLALAACAASVDGAEPPPRMAAWPPLWQQDDEPRPGDAGRVSFTPPRAAHCHRPPTLHEVPGQPRRCPTPGPKDGVSEPVEESLADRLERRAAPALESMVPKQVSPAPLRAPRATVTAGMVDDNADVGEYLAYRERHAGLPVRERDIRERYRLEVTDAAGRPVPWPV